MTWLAWADRALVLAGIVAQLESLRRLHRKLEGNSGEPGQQGRAPDHQS